MGKGGEEVIREEGEGVGCVTQANLDVVYCSKLIFASLCLGRQEVLSNLNAAALETITQVSTKKIGKQTYTV